MKVLSLKTITVPDNLNSDPKVAPLPSATFEGALSPEQHEEWLLAFSDPDEFNDIHSKEGDR